MIEFIAFMVYVRYILDRSKELANTMTNQRVNKRVSMSNKLQEWLTKYKLYMYNKRSIRTLNEQLRLANNIIVSSLDKLPEKSEIRYNPYFQVIRKLPYNLKLTLKRHDDLTHGERFAMLYAKYHSSKSQFKEILTKPITGDFSLWIDFLHDFYLYRKEVSINNYPPLHTFTAENFVDFAIYYLIRKLGNSAKMKIPNVNIQNNSKINMVNVNNNTSKLYKGLLEKLVIRNILKNRMNLTERFNFVHLLSNTELYVFLQTRKGFNSGKLNKNATRESLVALYHSYISQNLGSYVKY